MRWLVLFAFLPGCVFFIGDDDGGDQCHVPASADPAIAPAPVRNPETLQCQTIGGTCNPECGPCPLGAPDVTWPVCGSACEGLDEAACRADPGCRVIEHAECAIRLNCLTNYLGCFPVDTQADSSVDCPRADAWNCSRSNACTAFHSQASCPGGQPCDQPFELCMPEGEAPGRCWEQVICRALAPDCGPNKTPGVANGCYTGACIPVDLCEPM